MDVIIWGVGRFGVEAYRSCVLRGEQVVYFIDNDPKLWGKEKFSKQIISFEKYIKEKMSYQIVIATAYKSAREIESQLLAGGVSNYRIFDSNELYVFGGRLISYSDPRDKEDVILYHLLKDEKDIFYIDIGSNDPFSGNVTKLLYDMLKAHGINVEPQAALAELTQRERPRDITLCLGCGDEETYADLYRQEGGSTFLDDNVILRRGEKDNVRITTLKKICDEYLASEQKISFLKIDVEGFEEKVLLGADFNKYRPEIIVIESTLPRTDIPCYEKWEYILKRNNFAFAFAYGLNRYYVADEKVHKYRNKYDDISRISQIYNIYHPGLKPIIED